MVTGNHIAAADRSKDIDAEITAAGISVKASALSFHCSFGFAENIFR
jgi:hypothetical protein